MKPYPFLPKLDSTMIQTLLCHIEHDPPDILLLYDCCSPENGHGSVKPGRVVIELFLLVALNPPLRKLGDIHSLIP